MTKGKKETLYALLFSSLSKVITYFLLILFANLYSQTDYGVASFALNIRNLIMFFAFIGIPDALIPFIVKKKDINSIVKVLTSITILIFIAGLFLAINDPWIWPLVITFPLVMFTSLATSFLRSDARYDIPNRVGLVSIFITLIAAYFLAGYGLSGVVSAYALGNLYSFFAIIYPVKKQITKSFKGKFNFQETIPFFKAGITITAISGLFSLLIWINSTLLGILGNYEEVARFGVSSAIAGAISIIPISLAMFMLTRASQIENREKAKKVLHRVVRVSFFTSLLASILLISILPLLIKIFFSKYAGIELSTSILSLGMIFFSSYFVIYSYYIGRMESHKAILPVIIGVLVNSLLAFLLIPRFGLIGVSVALSLAHLSILIYIAFKERMKRISIMSIFAIILVYLSSLSLYIGIIILVLSIPLSLILKIINLEDIKVIKEAIFK